MLSQAALALTMSGAPASAEPPALPAGAPSCLGSEGEDASASATASTHPVQEPTAQPATSNSYAASTSAPSTGAAGAQAASVPGAPAAGPVTGAAPPTVPGGAPGGYAAGSSATMPLPPGYESTGTLQPAYLIGMRGAQPLFVLGPPDGVATTNGAVSNSGHQLVYMPHGVIMNISPAGVAVQYVPHSYISPGGEQAVPEGAAMQPIPAGGVHMQMPHAGMMQMQMPPPAMAGQPMPGQPMAAPTMPVASSMPPAPTAAAGGHALQDLALAAAHCS